MNPKDIVREGYDRVSHTYDAKPPVWSSTCWWCKNARANMAATSKIWSSGQGNLLVVDDQGRRVGTVGSQVITEIPDSFVTPIIGGLGKAQSIYSVPQSGTHTLILDGQTLTQTVTTQVTQFGPGYAVTADGIALKPSAQGQLTIAADGREATYQASDATEVNLTLALDDLDNGAVPNSATPATASSYTFEMSGLDVGSNQRVKASIDAAKGVVVLSNAQASSGNYDLQLTRGTSAGEQIFVHPSLQIAAGDTQYVDYANWNGTGSIEVKVDRGSDGTIDQITTIANVAANAPYRVYLPVVVR